MATDFVDARILETNEQFFKAGAKSLRTIGLSEDYAEWHFLVIRGSGRYNAEVDGPSVANDPYHAIPLYAVNVTRSVQNA